MSDVTEKAFRAKRLWESEDLQEFWGEALAEQSAVFLNPNSTLEQREEAHAIVRALGRVENKMAGAVLDHTLEKGQHRAND